MRIAQITPGVLSIPPNGWGAVEKIIWEYTQVLRKLGHDVEILYTDAVVKGEWDVVHVHMANLALLLKERGIPYVFSHHDHHAFHYGKESQVYKQNREAILGSQVSFVHAKYLVDYFDVPGKIRYLGHGANLNDYAFVDRSLDVLNLKPGLVMMANNGLAGNSLYDRKGFGSGIEAARELDLPITIICREEGNKELIEGLAPYNKLNVLYNLDYKSSIEEINKNHIFLNPSMLEAGHPNLTVAESIAMGLPVVGTGESRIPGTRTVTLKNLRVDHFELASAIEEVLNSYSSYVLECKNQRGLLSWEVVVSRMLMDYAQYCGVTQKQLLIDSYESIELRKEEQNLQSGYYVRFRDNPYLYKAKETNSEVSVSFVDDFTGEVIHKMTLGKGPRSWISPGDLSHRFVQWRVIVKEGSVVKWESWMDLRNQHVLVTGTQNLTPLDEEKLTEFATKVGCFLTVEGIAEDLKSFIIIGNDRTPFYRVLNLGQVYDYLSPKNRIQEKTLIKFLPKALGDNIAFVPYANEFAKSLGKKVYVNCHHRELFEGLFDSIEFVDDVQCTEFILVDYLFDVPLQVGFSQQLGLEFKEIRPQVRPPRKTSPRIKGKYVCFSTHSTAQAKHWNNAGGWTKLCDELKKVGLIPVCIDRHKQFGIQGHWNPIPTNCLDQSGGDLDHMMSLIKECEFFIGLSSGLSWLAHAMGKRVVIISGVTNPQNEFTIDCIRMHRDDVCHSCFNRPQEFKFDPGNWLWCPIHFGTGRQFECTKRISAKQVMDQLKERGWIYK